MNLFSSTSDPRTNSLLAALPASLGPSMGRVLQVALLLFAFYVFMVALQVMTGSFNLAGSSLAIELVNITTNPFTSLFIGLLATAVVQSSSTITSLIVTIVAVGGLTVPQATPMILGANIGTALTSTIVALGHIGDRREFQKAVSGASLHDLFNILTVALVFGFEVSTHALSGTAQALAGQVEAWSWPSLGSLFFFTRNGANLLLSWLADWPYLTMLLALVVLFLSLRLLTFILRSLVIGRIEQNLNRVLFDRPLRGLASGFVATVALQSSSLTTSLMVPLVATNKVSLRKAFPFIMGANVGTTTTALLAAMVASGSGSSSAALAVAFTHVLFNLFGVLVMYPLPRLRGIPVWLADRLGQLSYQNRLYGVAYVVITFFVLPFLLILITEGLAWLF